MSPWTLLSDQTRGSWSTCADRRTSSMGPVSTGPVSRSARANPRVRNALSRHSTLGCRCAPRPGSRPSVSRTRTAPPLSRWATMRARSDVAPRCRHPTQVRTGCFRTTVVGGGGTGAAGSGTALDRRSETARLTSPQCSRNDGGRAASTGPGPVRIRGDELETNRADRPQADTSVAPASGRHLRGPSFRPTLPCRAGCRSANR